MTSNALASARRVALCAFLIANCSLCARAGDYYVDAVNGNNANSGATPAQAWKTITHAISTLAVPGAPGVAETIHVAPGVYDSALGEVFPFRLEQYEGIQIVGSAGSTATILDGGGVAVILDCIRLHHYGYPGLLRRVEGLTLRNAQSALSMSSSEFDVQLICRDLAITNMAGWALSFQAGTSFFAGTVNATLEHIAISNCRGAIDAETTQSSLTGAQVNLTLSDSSIAHNRSAALNIVDAQGCSTSVVCTRVSMTSNAGGGVSIRQVDSFGTGGVASTEIADCLIAKNGRFGVHASYDGSWMPIYQASSIVTKVRRSTLAGNLGPGLEAFFTTIAAAQTHTTLSSTILHGNQDDVRENPAQPSIASPDHNDIGDGDFAGSNGNIALDPLFRNGPGGDFRLVFSSPCVDAGDPLAPGGGLDLAGVARPVDGNLDALEVADIGCHEFTPLTLVGTAHVGQALTLEQWGPSAGLTNLYMYAGPPFAAGLPTLFGQVDIPINSSRDLGTTPVGSTAPTQRMIQLSSNPLIIGRTFTFQSLSTSSVISPPKAYTNAVTIVVAP